MLAALGRIGVGVVFLVAVVAKLGAVEVVNASIKTGVGVLGAMLRVQKIVPASLADPLAVLVIAAEVAVGAWLLAHRRERAAAWTGVALLACLTGYSVLAWASGAGPTCACFGRATGAGVAWITFRNAILAGALSPTLLGGSRPPAPPAGGRVVWRRRAGS